jgi:hypothetical protein
MSSRRSRHVRRPPDLTSLFDVLFIVVFAVLIRGAAIQSEAANPRPLPGPPPVPQPPPDIAELKDKAIAQIDKSLADRRAVVARVSSAGSLVGIEVDDRKVVVDIPLLEQVRDPDVLVAYLGDRSADLRLCKQIALRLGVDDLVPYLVIVAPDRPLADLPHALYEGLRRDADRCLSEQRGIAAVVDATAEAALQQEPEEAEEPEESK